MGRLPRLSLLWLLSRILRFPVFFFLSFLSLAPSPYFCLLCSPALPPSLIFSRFNCHSLDFSFSFSRSVVYSFINFCPRLFQLAPPPFFFSGCPTSRQLFQISPRRNPPAAMLLPTILLALSSIAGFATSQSVDPSNISEAIRGEFITIRQFPKPNQTSLTFVYRDMVQQSDELLSLDLLAAPGNN